MKLNARIVNQFILKRGKDDVQNAGNVMNV